MTDQQMRVDAENGAEFVADEVSVSHSPVRFIVDFKSITPRVDINGQPARMVVKHNTVRVEPYLIKELISVLQDNVKKYEERFGAIEKPKALEKAEKEHHHHTQTKQDYFG